MQSAQIVRIIAHETNVQVLCSDEQGLISVYFDQAPFISFYKLIKKSKLKISGLRIEFNHDWVHISALGKTCRTRLIRRNPLKILFGK